MTPPPHLRLVPEIGGESDHAEPGAAMTIDCEICEVRDTDACDDCVVSYLVGHEVGTPVVLDADEKRAVELLADAGLVPASRFTPRPGVA
jgi:hypothetical protein